MEPAGVPPDEDAFAAPFASEVFAADDFFAGVFAAGFASGVVLSAGFAVEAPDESCAALGAGVCCAGELALCSARAGDKKIVPASSMAAAPHIKVGGLKNVGFCIPIFWHLGPGNANE